MFFLAAFLDHYRRLGVDQFLILDDSSSDGTREFLSAQADCLVLSSDLGFGDPVAAGGEGGARTTRAGTLLKRIILEISQEQIRRLCRCRRVYDPAGGHRRHSDRHQDS